MANEAVIYVFNTNMLFISVKAIKMLMAMRAVSYEGTGYKGYESSHYGA